MNSQYFNQTVQYTFQITTGDDASNVAPQAIKKKYSEEELKRIDQDLDAIIETRQKLLEYGSLYPVPLNGKSWKEERNEWFDRQERAIHDLLNSGKIQSCEMREYCQRHLKDSEKNRKLADQHPYTAIYFSIAPVEPIITSQALIKKAIEGNLTEQELQELEDELNSKRQGCHEAKRYDGPRASIDDVIEEAQRLIVDPDYVETYSAVKPKYQDSCTIIG